MNNQVIFLILVIFLLSCQTNLKNEVDKMENNQIIFIFGETFQLGVNMKAVSIDKDIEIEVKSIISEEIEAFPENEDAYPAGNGVTVNLVIKKDIETKEISLYLLSKGYESKIKESWNGYTITLINAAETAKLKIELEK